MEQTVSFGYWLRQRRRALDLTQEELARRVGCATGTIKKIETDERRPSREIAALLATQLQLAPEERDDFIRCARAELAPDQLPPPTRSVPRAAFVPAPATRITARTTFSPLNALNPQRTNLLAQPTRLIGRDQEVAAVCARLRGSEMRLVTLTGPGGIGKTRLGLQVAAELRDDFPDGVYFVDLAPIREPALVISAIAQTLGLRETGGQPLVTQLKQFLSAKCLLLLLDNFEHVLDAAPLPADLLAAAACLKLLVTSRERLHLRGEKEVIVSPLALPDRTALPPLDQLAQYAAVALFIQRASDARPDFQLTNANAAAVAEICARLDGLPLAIELAATRSKLFAPEALLARLSSPLALLIGGARDLPERQQTIRSTIAWSYDLLTAAEQRLFRCLSVFVGGCTLEASIAVYDTTVDPNVDVLDRLAALVNQSLLRQEEGLDGEPRFRMLETIREYALEQLEQHGETESIRRRHATYYLALAETAEPQLHGAEQPVWLARLEEEHGNLRTVVGWALEHGAVELAARLSAALTEFWALHNHQSQGMRWLTAALASSESLSTGVRAKALAALGLLAREVDDPARAQPYLEASLALFRDLQDQRGIANVLIDLGHVVMEVDQGDLKRAAMLLAEGLTLAQEVGDSSGVAWARVWLGLLAVRQGHYAAARVDLEESLALYRKQGYKRGAAWALLWLGKLAFHQGDYPSLRTLNEERLALEQALGNKFGMAHSLYCQAIAALYQGEYVQTTALCEASLALLQEVEIGGSSAVVLEVMGHVAMAQGAYVAADSHYNESLALYREINNQVGIACVIEGFADLAAAQGWPERAARLCGAGAALGADAFVFYDQRRQERIVATVRAQLDDATFAAAWAAGQALSLEQAIAEALQSRDMATHSVSAPHVANPSIDEWDTH